MNEEIKVTPKKEHLPTLEEDLETVVAQKEKETGKKYNPIEDYLTQVENVMPEFGGMEELGAILSLDDENFNLIASAFIMNLERAINNINDKMLLIQGMNAMGYKAEDVVVAYSSICSEIDEQLASTIPANKRDFIKRVLGIITNAIADTEGIAKKIIQIPIELTNKDAKIPTYAHIGDAGCDVYAIEDITIIPGETKIIPTGIKVAVPEGFEVQVRPRSGLSSKTKFRIANAPGTIDSSFRGELGIIIENIEPPIKNIDYSFNEDGSIHINSILHGSNFTIGKGERIAQLVLNEVPKIAFYKVENIEEYVGTTERGIGGFGSTDIQKANG